MAMLADDLAEAEELAMLFEEFDAEEMERLDDLAEEEEAEEIEILLED